MTSKLRTVALAGGAFVAMEPLAYAAHRWLMHGPGEAWHESHHHPRAGLVEKNDLYPTVFGGLTVAAFAAGARWPRAAWLTPVATGVTAYGVAYALVHDGLVHRRLPGVAALTRRSPLAARLARAHRRHHVDGREPYGMLVPLGSARREAAAPSAGVPAAGPSAVRGPVPGRGPG